MNGIYSLVVEIKLKSLLNQKVNGPDIYIPPLTGKPE